MSRSTERKTAARLVCALESPPQGATYEEPRRAVASRSCAMCEAADTRLGATVPSNMVGTHLMAIISDLVHFVLCQVAPAKGASSFAKPTAPPQACSCGDVPPCRPCDGANVSSWPVPTVCAPQHPDTLHKTTSVLPADASPPETMDSAYDHIQEENYPQDPPPKSPQEKEQDGSNFNTEIQDAYKAISSSPWATRIGGFWSSAKKQVGCPYRQEPRDDGLMDSTGRTVL
jgi:hypothetical protein